MKTKIKSIIVIVVMLISTNAMSQRRNRKPPSIEKRVDNVIKSIEKEIDINKSQKDAIEDAFTVFYSSADKEMTKGGRPEKSIMESFENVRDNKIKKVLGRKKYKKYLKISDRLKPRPPKMNRNKRQ